jgi:alkanesulfonate monooxygenase SsuD/methylene tetrahydromethanopterin reductase-like flavin-dependent oxidoreductase (luciferase family)
VHDGNYQHHGHEHVVFAFPYRADIVDAVRAIPGEGLDVPVWILGSSLYGAQLAAYLGLPYASRVSAARNRPSSPARSAGSSRSS